MGRARRSHDGGAGRPRPAPARDRGWVRRNSAASARGEPHDDLVPRDRFPDDHPEGKEAVLHRRGDRLVRGATRGAGRLGTMGS